MILKYKTQNFLVNHVLYQIAYISIMSCIFTLNIQLSYISGIKREKKRKKEERIYKYSMTLN